MVSTRKRECAWDDYEFRENQGFEADEPLVTELYTADPSAHVFEGKLGPFVFQGRILTPVIGWTTHHSIVEFGDKWYLFYHDASLSGGVNHNRSMKFTELRYNADGTIQTIDPYAGK